MKTGTVCIYHYFIEKESKFQNNLLNNWERQSSKYELSAGKIYTFSSYAKLTLSH